jgi:hypothetical protein
MKEMLLALSLFANADVYKRIGSIRQKVGSLFKSFHWLSLLSIYPEGLGGYQV